jgi:hypothetical protein
VGWPGSTSSTLLVLSASTTPPAETTTWEPVAGVSILGRCRLERIGTGRRRISGFTFSALAARSHQVMHAPRTA